MNEIDHFFDMEIKRAEDRIAQGLVECFNGVEVGSELAKKLNREHIVFCKNAKKSLANYENIRESEIKEMQSHIDCLKAELAEIQQNKPEPPLDPIDVAKMLINATITRKSTPFQKAFNENCPDEYEDDRYSGNDLRQIAEHLLVYCNHAEVE